MAKKTKEAEEENMEISQFYMKNLKNNSKVTFIGQDTNYKKIYSQYKSYFNSENKVKLILERLPPNCLLVIDESNPLNRLDKIVYYYNNNN